MTQSLVWRGFPGGSDGKESACNAEDPGSVPGLGRSPGEKDGYPLQYACLENPMDRESVSSWENYRKGMKWKVLAAAAVSLQSCPTLCDSIDGSPPGSPVPGILQARILEWVAVSFSDA